MNREKLIFLSQNWETLTIWKQQIYFVFLYTDSTFANPLNLTSNNSSLEAVTIMAYLIVTLTAATAPASPAIKAACSSFKLFKYRLTNRNTHTVATTAEATSAALAIAAACQSLEALSVVANLKVT